MAWTTAFILEANQPNVDDIDEHVNTTGPGLASSSIGTTSVSASPVPGSAASNTLAAVVPNVPTIPSSFSTTPAAVLNVPVVPSSSSTTPSSFTAQAAPSNGPPSVVQAASTVPMSVPTVVIPVSNAVLQTSTTAAAHMVPTTALASLLSTQPQSQPVIVSLNQLLYLMTRKTCTLLPTTTRQTTWECMEHRSLLLLQHSLPPMLPLAHAISSPKVNHSIPLLVAVDMVSIAPGIPFFTPYIAAFLY
ncbi:hypothetical protein VKT23_013875 [Stygiomarasmius scandens]|uniref:Uncharacterized protein n=1 Tax=Marasmiellus scandens TaxID=2682957 RepID=A0ABR1J2H0_9AGAR